MLVQESVIQDSNCFLLHRRNDLQHNHFQIPLQSVHLFLGDLPLRYLHHYFLQHISLHSPAPTPTSSSASSLSCSLAPSLSIPSSYSPSSSCSSCSSSSSSVSSSSILVTSLSSSSCSDTVCVLHLGHAQFGLLHFYHCFLLHHDLDPFQDYLVIALFHLPATILIIILCQ